MNLNGQSSLTFADQNGKFSLDSSYLLLIPPNTDFSTQSPDLIDHFYIHFLMRPPYSAAKSPCYIIGLTDWHRSLIKQIHLLLDNCGSLTRLTLLCQALCSDALLSIPDNHVIRNYTDERVINAVAFMESNLHRLISNREFGKIAGMNPGAFARLFLQVTGYGLQEYFINLRLDHAGIMLKFGSEPINEIARQCGFGDRYHFSRAFTARRGIGPARYRKSVT